MIIVMITIVMITIVYSNIVKFLLEKFPVNLFNFSYFLFLPKLLRNFTYWRFSPFPFDLLNANDSSLSQAFNSLRYCPFLIVLPKCEFHIEERYSSNEKHDEISNQECACEEKIEANSKG